MKMTNLSGARQKGLRKAFRLPEGFLGNGFEALSWQKTHRKTAHLHKVGHGESVLFVWKSCA